MATDDNKRAEIVSAIYEAEVLSATVAAALEGLQTLPEAQPVKEQIGVIRKLALSLDDMISRLGDLLRKHFRPATQ